jgi:predicted acyltransferase (DUF342 family)
MIFAGVIAACALLLVLPFLPGLRELRKPRDAAPLGIDMERTKDPGFFGNSFRALLSRARADAGDGYGVRALNLSHVEDAEIVPALAVPAGGRMERLAVVDGEFSAGRGAHLEKEIFAAGRAAVGDGVSLRALACETELELGRDVQVLRWIDARGDIRTGRDCDLGLSAFAAGRLALGAGCRFRRLFGRPIQTEGADPAPAPVSGNAIARVPEIGDSAWIVDAARMVIPRAAVVNETIIVKTRLVVNPGVVLKGDVKCYHDLLLDDDVSVLGNVFSDGDITIGRGCRIAGSVFAQGRVTIGEGARVGGRNAEKSVVGKKGVSLGRGVEIFGVVSTEGCGAAP